MIDDNVADILISSVMELCISQIPDVADSQAQATIQEKM